MVTLIQYLTIISKMYKFEQIALKNLKPMLSQKSQMSIDKTGCSVDYGRAMKPFFYRNPKLLGLGRQFGQIHFGAFRVFSNDLSAPISVL